MGTTRILVYSSTISEVSLFPVSLLLIFIEQIDRLQSNFANPKKQNIFFTNLGKAANSDCVTDSMYTENTQICQNED